MTLLSLLSGGRTCCIASRRRCAHLSPTPACTRPCRSADRGIDGEATCQGSL